MASSYFCRSNPRRRKPTAQTPAPPPNAPLPAPPQLRIPPAAIDLSNVPNALRRPGTKRAQTTDSTPTLAHTPSIPIPGRLSPSGTESTASSPFARSWAHNTEGETDMEDYPIPLDTPGEVRGEYFA